MWSHFSHQADIGIQAEADSLPSAFEDAALALAAIITEKPTVKPIDVVQIECSAQNNEILLID